MDPRGSIQETDPQGWIYRMDLHRCIHLDGSTVMDARDGSTGWICRDGFPGMDPQGWICRDGIPGMDPQGWIRRDGSKI